MLALLVPSRGTQWMPATLPLGLGLRLQALPYSSVGNASLSSLSLSSPQVGDRAELFNQFNFDEGGRRKKTVEKDLLLGLQPFARETRKVPGSGPGGWEGMDGLEGGEWGVGVEGEGEWGGVEGDGLIEEVDRFRFVVDPKELRRAVETGSALRVRQARDSGGGGGQGDGSGEEGEEGEGDLDPLQDLPDLFLDPSIVQSLMAAEGSGLVDPVRYKAELDYDDFAKGLYATEEEAEAGDEGGEGGADDGKKKRSDRSSSYSSERMRKAEQTVSQPVQPSNSGGASGSKSGGSGGGGSMSGRGRGKAGSKRADSVRLARTSRKAILDSLLLTPQKEVAADLIGAGFMLALSVVIVATYDKMILLGLRGWELLVSRLGALFPILQRRRCLPALLLGTAAACLVHYIVLPWRKRRQFSWVGYAVPQR